MIWFTKILEIIKEFASIIIKNATLILVIVTGIYAYFTYKMAKIMSMQVIADIVVTNKILGSIFSESYFRDQLKNNPEQINKDSYFSFKLLFDVSNKSPGSGSIDKPTLIIKFSNDNYEYSVLPKTKESWNEKLEESRAMTTYRTIINDMGGTIFLRGGESQKAELEYNLYDFDKILLDHIKEHLESVEYYIKFKDNFGKRHLLKIDKIKGIREASRK